MKERERERESEREKEGGREEGGREEGGKEVEKCEVVVSVRFRRLERDFCSG